jgi:hypothetical protein
MIGGWWERRTAVGTRCRRCAVRHGAVEYICNSVPLFFQGSGWPSRGPANFLLPDDGDLDFDLNLHQYRWQEFELSHTQAPSVSRSGSFPAGIFLLLENCDEVIKAVQAVV